LLNEHGIEIRRCLKKDAHKVQVDFIEGRLAVKIDFSGNLLTALLTSTISRCRGSRQKNAGTSGSVPAQGNDFDSTHSARMSMFVRTRHELALVLRRRLIFN